MANALKSLLLKYGIPCLMVLVIAIQLYNVNVNKLNRWKGGGYGMYSEIHYYYNQIHIPEMSIDSLVKEEKLKASLGFLMVMPNKENLKESAELVLKSTKKDSVHMQIWKPTISSKSGAYSRVLINEIRLKSKNQ